MIKAVFEGLVYDPKGEPIKVAYVGSEPCYVLNDDGFLRYIPAGDVDWQVWEALTSQIIGHEDILSRQLRCWVKKIFLLSRCYAAN